jgi:hypothetical protein
VPPASFEFPHFLLILFLQHLSQGSVDVPTMQAEVTRVGEATRVVAVLAAETSAKDAAMTRDSTVAWVKDAED